jgi:hypothetical protein
MLQSFDMIGSYTDIPLDIAVSACYTRPHKKGSSELKLNSLLLVAFSASQLLARCGSVLLQLG